MVKIVHTADFHLGVPPPHDMVGEGLRELRRRDFLSNMNVVVEEALRADMLLICGDIFNKTTPSPADLNAVAECIGRLSEAGVITVAIAGNHDRPKSAGAQTYLEAIPKARAPRFYYFQSVPNEPLVVDVKGERVAIVPIPFVHPAAVAAKGGNLAGEYEKLIRERCESLLDHEAVQSADVKILMAHLTTLRAKYSTYYSWFSSEVKVSESALRFKDFDYVALGHIHRPQAVADNAYYSGSIERINFGEAGEEKSFVVAEVKGGKLDVRAVPLPSRKMITGVKVKASGTEDAIKQLAAQPLLADVKEALVDLVVELVAPSKVDRAAIWARLASMGAVGCRVTVRPAWTRVAEAEAPADVIEFVMTFIDGLAVDAKVKRRAKEVAREMLREAGL